MTEKQTTTVADAIGQEWLKRLKYAKDARKSFDAVADACYSFYSKSGKFMWEEKFKRTYLGNVERPKFEVTLNAAKEYVDIFGPYLFWDYPHRTAKAYEPLQVDWQTLMQMADPWEQETLAEQQQEYAMRHVMAEHRAQLMERYLNYTPREQPSGLWQHSNAAIIDALVKGRGVLVPRVYSTPGSQRKLTGLFHEPVQNLFIDPDCTDCLLETASWIAIRHETQAFELEDRFKLQRGTLDEAGLAETAEHIVEFDSAADDMNRKNGKSNNIVVWYEIWSKCGISCKKERLQSEFAQHVDSVVGDYVYLCVAVGVPWLLNAPPAAFYDGISDEEVSEMLGWPFPSYKDNRWPLALLDFCPDPESPWPIAPLSAGLGHLICLNVLMSAYVEQAYENRKSIIAVLKSAAKDVLSQINGNLSPAVVELNADVAKDIKQVIQYLNRPNMNTDILGAIELTLQLFQKATGLVDFMYGQEQKVSRSAQDIVAKQEKTAVRPEKMAKDVAAWQTEAARLETLLSALELSGEDVDPHIPAMLWDRFIGDQDPELLMREMDIVIEATDVRRPNRERDLANLQVLAQQSAAAFMQAAQMNGDWGPFNAFHKQIWKAMEQPWVPEMEIQNVDPNAEGQAEAEMEQMKLQGEMAKTEADIEAKQIDAQTKMQLAEMKMAMEQQKMQLDAMKSQQELAFNEAKERQGLLFDRARFTQESRQDEESHYREMRQSQESHSVSLRNEQEAGKQKVSLMRQQAKAKPSTNGKKK